MRLRDLLHETLSAFNANRARSLLTVLGIVIGISAVIAMTALIDGIKYSLVGSLGLNQSRMVSIYAWPDRGVTQQDLDQLAMSVPGYEFVTGIDSSAGRIDSIEKQFDTQIIGCQPEYFTAMGFKASARSSRNRMWTMWQKTLFLIEWLPRSSTEMRKMPLVRQSVSMTIPIP